MSARAPPCVAFTPATPPSSHRRNQVFGPAKRRNGAFEPLRALGALPLSDHHSGPPRKTRTAGSPAAVAVAAEPEPPAAEPVAAAAETIAAAAEPAPTVAEPPAVAVAEPAPSEPGPAADDGLQLRPLLWARRHDWLRSRTR